MGLATCYPCTRHLLLALNLFFWLSGFSLIVLGICFLLRPEVQHIINLFNFSNLPLSPIEVLACFLILVGIIIFLVGLFGYCGAQRESRTCLIIYIGFVTCILLVELGLFMAVAMYHEQGQSLIEQRLVSQIERYNHMYPSQYEKSVDYIQNRYYCCGIKSAYDYSSSHLPMSCCSMSSSSSCNVHQVALTRTTGCLSTLKRTTFFWMQIFTLIELALCALSLIGIFLAICVCQNTMLYDGYTEAPSYI